MRDGPIAKEAIAAERLRTLLDNIPDRIYFKDLNGCFTQINHALARHFGLDDPELAVGKRDFDYFSHEHAQQAFDDEREIIRTGNALIGKVEKETFRDGIVRWVTTTKMALHDANGKIIGTFGISRDITERKKAEERMELQSAALEATANAIFITDARGVIEWANAAFTACTGYSAAEVIGKTPKVLTSGKHDETFYKNLWKTITSGKVWEGEVIDQRKDGRLFTGEMTITPMKDSRGEITHFIAVNQDITEHKKLEAHFLRAQRMESIGTLAGGIAHDLNNVLAPILMAIEILEDRSASAEERKILGTLETSALHGAELVKQVLAFARGIEGQRLKVNPVHLLENVEKIVRDTFPKNINFSFAPGRDLWTVTGDSTQLHQVFTNLCVNARDAMPYGGALSITMENARLDDMSVETNPDLKAGTYVMVTVADTGAGIPARIRDRIFEPFFTTKEIGKGTGLGLSTTMAIIKSHGGFINLYSEVGKGTSFKVYLPASPAAEGAATKAGTKSPLPRGNGELLLVVDDDESIRGIAKKTVERFGYRALIAANGAEAVAMYAKRSKEIALVLTDMEMPVMDGAATLIALKAINPEIRVVGSGGLALAGAAANGGQSGFVDFIQKPYRAEAMLKVIAKALGGGKEV